MATVVDRHRDLATLLAMVGELDRFLDDGRPFRPVSVDLPAGGRVSATMSIGAVLELLAVLRDDGQSLTEDERDRLDQAEQRLLQLRSARKTAYRGALERELKSQLDTWRWFLDDCARGERDRVADYRFEAGVRTRIAFLTEEAQAVGADVRQSSRDTAALDEELKRALREGPYLGPAGQANRFPKPAYWWLYGRPKTDD